MATANDMPSTNIEQVLKDFRSKRPQTDPEAVAKFEARAVTVAPAYCAMLKAIADFIDVSRASGYSAGEAVATINLAIQPLDDMPMVKTDMP